MYNLSDDENDGKYFLSLHTLYSEIFYYFFFISDCFMPKDQTGAMSREVPVMDKISCPNKESGKH